MVPTTKATALVAVTWRYHATAAPDDASKAILKAELATQLGVDPTTGIRNFDVTSQAVELTTYEWSVFFNIFSTGDAAASTAASAVASLEDPAFEAKIQASIPVIQAFEIPVPTQPSLPATRENTENTPPHD